jgi:pimeloyl-ACP methyl ester carboxylesterase
MKRWLFILLLLPIGLAAHAYPQSPQNMNSKTIVLIHGLFMNAKSWQPWKVYFEKAGYNVVVPEYPFHSGEPADLRKQLPEGLRKLDLTAVIAYLEGEIKKLPEKPILVGHSIGGLLVQILINKGLGERGVSIDPAPPKGVFTIKWSFLKANLPTINPFKGNSVFLPSVKWFHYAFCNTLTMAETQKIYDTYLVPEARNIPRETTKKAGKIDFAKPHAPLLIIAGEKDNIIPPSLNKKNWSKYSDKGSVTDFKEFPGRSHILCLQPGWEEIADYVLGWIRK